MSYDISESLSPTVTLSVTPTTERELNYLQYQPLVLSAERFRDVTNLKVNQRRSRSFTPVKNSIYLHSPELSPIGLSNNRQLTPESTATTTTANGADTLTPGQFKVPQLLMANVKNVTPTGPPGSQHPPRKGSVDQNATTTSTDDPNVTHSLDKSASHGYLNHKLDVRLILKNASLHHYIKAFNKEKIDFEKFLTLSEEDLLRLGVKRKLDRKVILSLIEDLNTNY